MRIALDAMGSDRAPGPEVAGAVEASLELSVDVILVGDEAKIKPALDAYPKRGNISVIHAPEAITMGESPVMAVRQKRGSSMLVALRLAKEAQADAVVSAGNTGAVMVAARAVLGPIRGVGRSAICQILPSTRKPVLLLDVGANVDCTARHLCDFAEMGMIYSKLVFGTERPKVGLLNIGEEQSKGNEVAKTVHRILSASEHMNFVGNVEPKSIYQGEVDVVVCDGFVGNVILKTSEAVAGFITTLVKQKLSETFASRIGALLSMGAFKRLKSTIDPNEYCGAPLLGVNGTVIIHHGACNKRGIANAIRGATVVVERNINGHIRTGIESLRSTENCVKPRESTG